MEAVLHYFEVSRQIFGVISHNAIDVGKAYHSCRCSTYKKVIVDTSSLSDEYTSILAVEAANDTADLRGLIFTLLVLGVSPHLPLRHKLLPNSHHRMNALHAEKREIARINARACIDTATYRRVSVAVDVDIQLRDKALWYREKPNSKWTGSFSVTRTCGQLLLIDVGDRSMNASIDCV